MLAEPVWSLPLLLRLLLLSLLIRLNTYLWMMVLSLLSLRGNTIVSARGRLKSRLPSFSPRPPLSLPPPPHQPPAMLSSIGEQGLR